MNALKRVLPVLLVLLLMVLALGACSSATTSANCAFVSGNTSNDRTLKKIVYPGRAVDVASNEQATYVPCGSRNYIINDGKTKDPNGNIVGDRGTLITATVASGVTITIAARAQWTLNQSDKAMRAFYVVCAKYTCASTENKGGSVNFSTPGWNGMLAENFGPTMDLVAKETAYGMDNTIWERHDPGKYQELQDGMSKLFAEKVRTTNGYSEDLFCGSGNSDWKDHDLPGEGDFFCSPVRIIVDDVQLLQGDSGDNNAGNLAVNQQRRTNAHALYGDLADYWLGLIDAINACKATPTLGVTCVVNLGGGNGALQSPTPVSAVPAPAPTLPPN